MKTYAAYIWTVNIILGRCMITVYQASAGVGKG